ncbi:MAG: Exopolyphosphatase [Turneriella sp.]|nr:Exopolyphosphatase [Turneriella sp.]
MHIAIIDVGSNNIKLEVFALNSDAHSQLLYNAKFPARLGSDVFLTRRLRPENVDAAIAALKKIHNITKDYACKETIAIATAALRECESSDFIERAKRETGISISVISGLEEARLIYNGIRAHTSLGAKNYFINDIGGGSTEILIANDTDIHFVESLRLGTVRLKEMFGNESKELLKLIDRFVSRSLNPYMRDIHRYPIEAGLCTGGSSRTLLEVLREMGAPIKEELELPRVETKVFEEIVQKLLSMSSKEITRVKSIDDNRRDIILPGAALLLSLLKNNKIDHFVVSPNGLRDGALAEYVFNNIDKNIYLRSKGQFRKTGLNSIVDKYKMDRAHSERVAKIAAELFDDFSELHKLPKEYRELLVASAMLHDIGKFIDYSQHHKHSLYILSNIKLPGYSDLEKQIIAHTARYHRKSNPKPTHLEYKALPNATQEVVLKLSVLLRIADALDRGASNGSTRLHAEKILPTTWCISFKTDNTHSFEKWAFDEKKESFEKVFNVKLVLQ